MPRRLIINADDFGLTRGVNRSIQELAAAGALTSATLMASGGEVGNAVALAKQTPRLGVGCHVVLTDGIPICTPGDIPTLIGKDGKRFRASLKDFWQAVLLGRVDPKDIEREAGAQIQSLQLADLPVTHVDTHKHTHILPGVAAPLLRAAEKLGVRAVRNPFEEGWSLKLSHGNLKRSVQIRIMALLRTKFEALPQLRSGALVTTDGTIGISATGRLDTQILNSLLQNMPEGTWELVCHPGYNDQDLNAITTRLKHTRFIEHQALLSAFTQGSSHLFPIELIHYGMLSNKAGTPRTAAVNE